DVLLCPRHRGRGPPRRQLARNAHTRHGHHRDPPERVVRTTPRRAGATINLGAQSRETQEDPPRQSGVGKAAAADRRWGARGALSRPAFNKGDAMPKITPTVTQIASGLRFPEGPVAMPDGSVILVEIARQTLSRVTPDGKINVIAALGGGPNGA